MKQYWMLILLALQDVVFSAVDGTFANNVSLDVIVALNSFTMVMYLCLRPIIMGIYAYQSMQSNPKNCLVCTIISSTITGCILAACAVPISYIFTLTDVQREMVQQVLILFSCCAPIQGVSRFLIQYCIYTGKNKLIFWTSLITYIQMILTDWLAVSLESGAFGLRLSTEICWFLYLLILLPASGILKVQDKIEPKIVKHCFWVGKDACIAQIIIRIGTISMTSIASAMGTASYAIHSVAIGIVILAESFRDATYEYGIINLRDYRDDLRRRSLVVLKQIFVPALLLPLALEAILVVTMHGKVSVLDAAMGTLLYSCPFLIYPLQDLSSAAVRLSSVRSTAIKAGIASAVIRGPILWCLSQLWEVSLPMLGLIYAADYIARTLCYRTALRKEHSHATT